MELSRSPLVVAFELSEKRKAIVGAGPGGITAAREAVPWSSPKYPSETQPDLSLIQMVAFLLRSFMGDQRRDLRGRQRDLAGAATWPPPPIPF